MGRGGTGPDSVFMIILLFLLGCSPFAALQQPCGEGEGLTLVSHPRFPATFGKHWLERVWEMPLFCSPAVWQTQ